MRFTSKARVYQVADARLFPVLNTMSIRHYPLPHLILIVLLWLLFQVNTAVGQTPCSNPVSLSSILISNATCSNATGTIILNLGSGAYQFNWTPAVSVSNVASNLQAGTYHVEVVRADNPDCTLDTTIVVNNSNGPAVQVSSIEPANCLATNGKVTLSPFALTYTWSNGETGAINDGLAAGCYFVTATNASGCYSVHKICVPNTNPLNSNVVVLQNAKCGLPTGAANVIVNGGSGQYTYTLGAAPPFTDLQAALYFCGISDVITGCTDEVSFLIEDIPVNATLELMPQNVQCPGENNGSVSIALTPGDNFALPYTAVVQNAQGDEVTPGQLPPGQYVIHVNDASGCPLPPDTFLIQAPPLFVSQALVVPGNCLQGGQILLTLSGGTGPLRVDWADLPGNNNPEDRQNLLPGLYSASVFDSLGCTFSVNPVLVTSTCVGIDTVTLEVSAGATDTFCMGIPAGVQPGAVTFFMQGSGTNVGSSIYGNWILKPNGCLLYTAGTTMGQAVDTICIIRDVNITGLDDTVCVLVNIVQQACLPIHTYQPDGTGTVAWVVSNCNVDTMFCTTIPYGEFAFWSITDFLQPPQSVIPCGTNTGVELDTGLHLLQIRNLQNTCIYNVRVLIQCPMDTIITQPDTTYAVPDAVYTQRGVPVSIPLLDNDIIIGTAGNLAGLAALELLNVPADGQYTYQASTGILTYSPEENQCAPASFTYQLTDTLGRQSETTVTVTVICDKILVFNGISPNGDNLNDEWHLPGIEQYPLNEVRVFNRWGQMVFEHIGYSNATGWDGRWNGRDLPDGTYYYTIDLKDGSKVLSGFLQIQR